MSYELAGLRDASWYNCPDVRTGKAYHVYIDGRPACDQHVFLVEETTIFAADVPAELRCKRAPCAKRFRKALKEQPYTDKTPCWECGAALKEGK